MAISQIFCIVRSCIFCCRGFIKIYIGIIFFDCKILSIEQCNIVLHCLLHIFCFVEIKTFCDWDNFVSFAQNTNSFAFLGKPHPVSVSACSSALISGGDRRGCVYRYCFLWQKRQYQLHCPDFRTKLKSEINKISIFFNNSP